MIFFLLTTRFPYENGEPFISNELSCISKDDIVYIIPFNNAGGKITFSLPNTCRLIESNNYNPRLTNILLRLMRRDHVKVFTSEIIQLVKEGRFHYLTFKRAFAYMFFATKGELKLEKIVKQYADHKPYVLYSYWASICALASALKKDSLSYYLTRMHGIDLYEERHEYSYLPFRTFLFDKADMICPISRNAEHYLNIKYQNRFPVQKCYVSHLGTEDCGINKFINRKELIIVSCSSVIKVKQVDLIWKALSGISQFPIKWIHFGDGILMNDLKKEIHNKRDTMLQYKLMGHVDNKMLYEFYKKKSVDLFVNVSQSEGVPVSIMEAISFGIPVVATDVGGTSEIVNSDTGWLISADNIIEELQVAVQEYYAMSIDEKMERRYRTRRFWENTFKADVNYKDFYEKIKSNVLVQNRGLSNDDKYYNPIL